MKKNEPVQVVLAGIPFAYDPVQALRDLARAAAIYVRIRAEDRYLAIHAWPRPMLARYVEIEIECFVREWHLFVEEADIPRVTQAVVEYLADVDRESRQSTSAM